MDELRCRGRIARRLALALAIGCCASSVGAEESQRTMPSRSSFRSLLSRGWQENQTRTPEVTPAPEVTAQTRIVRPDTKLIQVAEPSLLEAAHAHQDTTSPRTMEQLPVPKSLADLIKGQSPPVEARTTRPDRLPPTIPQLPPSIVADQAVVKRSKSIQLPPSVQPPPSVVQSPPRVVQPPKIDTRPEKINEPPASLAELIQDLGGENATSVLAKPAIVPDPLTPAPSVNRLSMDQRASNELLAESESTATVKIAEPAEMAATAKTPATGPVDAGQPESADAEVADASNAPSVDIVREDEPEAAGTPLSEAAEAPSVIVTPGKNVSDVPQLETASKQSDPQVLEPLNNIGQDLQEAHSLTSTIHANRLREMARESLAAAQLSFGRRALHSARNHATNALRSVVAMNDVIDGGTEHATQLEKALDAIRESEDFCGRFGTIDQSALARMVAVHETGVLKNEDLSNISPLRATDLYLAEAKSNLVSAAKHSREASDALVVLGRIANNIDNVSDSHSAAVSLTMQRAAVEILPSSTAYRELGATLLKQGLLEQATVALNRSIEMQPSHSGYQLLLEASRRLGDVDLARRCIAAFKNGSVRPEIPVKRLEPKEFAATYRPAETISNPKPTTQKQAPAENTSAPPETKTPIISKARTWLSFGRL